MKTNIFYLIFILLSFSCKPKVVHPEKIKKIAIRTFTGKGKEGETTNWFYIRNVVERGFSGYYFETTAKLEDFKHADFVYSEKRPAEFEEQFATGEAVQFLNPDDLPEVILKDSSYLETLYN